MPQPMPTLNARAAPPQLAQPLQHICTHRRAASPRLVQPLLQLIRSLTVGVPGYGKPDATNKA